METNQQNSKIELRAKIRARLEKISPAVRAVESIDLCERLEPQLQSAQTILFFAPLPDELDVWPLLKKCLAANKICALPFYDAEKKHYGARQIKDEATDLVVGKFGVREPAAQGEEIDWDKIDLALVPGRAFDLGGNRVGRGLGFYDRLLEKISGLKCGVAYDFQLQEKIPAEPHDVKVNFIVTPTRCLRCKKN